MELHLTSRRHQRSSIASRYSLRGSIAIGVALLVSIFGASPASASPLREVADAAGSLVTTVTGAPGPSLPNGQPPAIPPAPIADPATPPAAAKVPPAKVPISPPVPSPSHQPTPSPAGAESEAAGAAAGVPSADRGASDEKQLSSSITSTSTQAPRQGGASDRNGLGASLDRERGHDPDKTAASGTRERSVGAAEAAPLRRWLAYVWPAVSLGPAARALAVLLPDLVGASAPPMPDPARLFTQVLGVAASSGGSALSEPASTPHSSQPAPYSDLMPSSGGMSFLATILTVIAALIAVVALARLTVGEEFFSMRWLH